MVRVATGALALPSVLSDFGTLVPETWGTRAGRPFDVIGFSASVPGGQAAAGAGMRVSRAARAARASRAWTPSGDRPAESESGH